MAKARAKKPHRVKIPAALSEGEETLAQHMNAYHIEFKREVKFCEDRGWRWDFVLSNIPIKCAIEVQGGTEHGKSTHSKGKGYENDCDKANVGMALGWHVLRFTTRQVRSGEAIQQIKNIVSVYYSQDFFKP